MGLTDLGNPALNVAVEKWLEWDRNEKTSFEIQQLVTKKDVSTLSNLLLKRMDFGTAGLRGRMGAGYSQMNDLVIVQTAQGLCQYLLKAFPDCRSRGVVVGYDGRHHSKRFAEITAAVFLADSISVVLFSSVCPTPFVPFTVLQYKCVAGVMVTASHNPKDDNGYKVYWENGAQIISPIDREITKSISENLEPLDSSWNTPAIHANPLLTDGLDDITYKYLDCLPIPKKIETPLKQPVVYTAMHGVGWRFIRKAFAKAGFSEPIPVEQQKDPDPEFPTVKFPNPEEGRSALDFSILTAEEAGCSLIIANDPDADRLAVAELEDGEWKIFNGNELGALLGWWMLQCYLRDENPNNLSDVYMLSSAVSSKILQTMGKKHGFNFIETLTGFKWMGNVADQLIKSGKKVLFAYEEAIGFMCGSSVLDKDGISAAVKLAELVGYLSSQKISLSHQLKNIYTEYGHHISNNSYFFCGDLAIHERIFNRLRNFYDNSNQSYPAGILNEKYLICSVRDLTTGYDSSAADKKATLPISNSSKMITFTFTNGLICTIRTSGTEPKIKYYTELCAEPSIKDINELNAMLKEMIDAIVHEFLEPEKNHLIPRDH